MNVNITKSNSYTTVDASGVPYPCNFNTASLKLSILKSLGSCTITEATNIILVSSDAITNYVSLPSKDTANILLETISVVSKTPVEAISKKLDIPYVR